MKALVKITLFMLAGMHLLHAQSGRITPSESQEPVKIYRIDNEENYKYFLIDGEKTLKGDTEDTVYMPITLRTLYLESYRTGIIPGTIDYRTFSNMPLADKQRIINNYNYNLNKKKRGGLPERQLFQISERVTVMLPVIDDKGGDLSGNHSMRYMQVDESPMLPSGMQHKKMQREEEYPYWIIGLTTHRKHHWVLPDRKKPTTEKSTTTDSGLPWIIGLTTNQQYAYDLPPIPVRDNQLEKDAKFRQLVIALITHQQEEYTALAQEVFGAEESTISHSFGAVE